MLFIASSGILLWPFILKLTGGTKEIGTLETTRLMNSGNALVLDIRDTGAFNGGRIPKSKNIPSSEIDKRVVSSVPISLAPPVSFEMVGHNKMPPLAMNNISSVRFCEMNSFMSRQ